MKKKLVKLKKKLIRIWDDVLIQLSFSTFLKFLSKRVNDKPCWDDQRGNDYDSDYDSSDWNSGWGIDKDIDDRGYEADGDDH